MRQSRTRAMRDSHAIPDSDQIGCCSIATTASCIAHHKTAAVSPTWGWQAQASWRDAGIAGRGDPAQEPAAGRAGVAPIPDRRLSATRHGCRAQSELPLPEITASCREFRDYRLNGVRLFVVWRENFGFACRLNIWRWHSGSCTPDVWAATDIRQIILRVFAVKPLPYQRNSTGIVSWHGTGRGNGHPVTVTLRDVGKVAVRVTATLPKIFGDGRTRTGRWRHNG